MDERQRLVTGTQQNRYRGAYQEASQDDRTNSCSKDRDQDQAYGKESLDSHRRQDYHRPVGLTHC